MLPLFYCYFYFLAIFVDINPVINGFRQAYFNNHRILRPHQIQKIMFVPSQVNTKKLSQVEDDGYSLSSGKKSIWKRAILRLTSSPIPGTLILIRHGETTLNYNKTYTGWIDTDISERGIQESEHAARLLLERGYSVDTIYTSRLKRAIRSSWIILKELNQVFRPVFKSWRLNERMYGSLEGSSKIESVLKFGEEAVQDFRNGLLGRPPPMAPNHPHWHKDERKYADLDYNEIPVTESLLDTMQRTIPLWENRILPDLREGKTVMIVAHANSLRGIVKHIDKLSPEDIKNVAIPNGIPLVYKFERGMKPIKMLNAEAPLSGEFLEKKGLLRAALLKEAQLTTRVPGIEDSVFQASDPRISSLTKLNLKRELFEDRDVSSLRSTATLEEFHSVDDVPKFKASPRVVNSVDGNYLVIIRHGKTEYNKLGIFTGWDDVPLAAEGRMEAMKAGKLLKLHGVEFDVVYTSWLSRAIETAWIVLNELDSLWLPIMKSWRLNERMYGALTRLSKKMIAATYGEERYRKWRRGFNERPPPVSSFSNVYPGNDDRYMKYIKDVRYSFFESIVRSLSHGRFELHRKFPKTESLKDCMSRTIPFFTNVIVPESIDKGKNVLIASSENAIRGLLMHLCEIPMDRIHEVEIPTGLPLIYDVKRKCIRLLEDDSDPEFRLSKYDFGTSPELLFRRCDTNDNPGALECFIDADGKSYALDYIIRLQNPVN